MAIDPQAISSQIQSNPSFNPDIFNTDPNTSGYAGINPLNLTNPSNFYFKLTYAFMWFVGTLAFLVLIYGGIMYITAGGEAEKAEKGKKAIIGAIVGIIIIAVSLLVYQATMKNLSTGGTAQQLLEETVD